MDARFECKIGNMQENNSSLQDLGMKFFRIIVRPRRRFKDIKVDTRQKRSVMAGNGGR